MFSRLFAKPKPLPITKETAASFRVIYAGRMLFLKGMHLGIPAFAQLLRTHPDARLTLVGDGPDKKRWQKLAIRHGVNDAIHWRGWLPRDELLALYPEHSAFLFPSLRDSGGWVVLEALAHGLPVVCLDIGGPGIIVDKSCGFAIRTAKRWPAEVSGDIGAALQQLADDPALRLALSFGAVRRVEDFSWNNAVGRVYSEAIMDAL